MTDYNPELIEELRQQRVAAQEKVAAAEKELSDINDKMFAELSKAPGEKVVIGDWTPKISRPNTTVYDTEGLQRAVGLVVWNKITNRVLDKDKLVREVDMAIIKKYSEEVPHGKPRVRVDKTKKEENG